MKWLRKLFRRNRILPMGEGTLFERCMKAHMAGAGWRKR